MAQKTGMVGQRLDAHRPVPGSRMADGQQDGHLVHPQEPSFDAWITGQPRGRVGDDGDVETAGDHAVVQLWAQPG
jgi:hypothetical protein